MSKNSLSSSITFSKRMKLLKDCFIQNNVTALKSVCQTYSWIWTLHELKGITVKSWQNVPISCFSFWMNRCFSNQLIQNRKISLNFFIGDARNHQPSSVLSMYLKPLYSDFFNKKEAASITELATSNFTHKS